MRLDGRINPETCSQYKVVNAETGEEIMDVVAADEEEGWYEVLVKDNGTLKIDFDESGNAFAVTEKKLGKVKFVKMEV
jgi:hypothetical protein